MNFLPNVRLSGENGNFIGISSNLITNFRQIDPKTNKKKYPLLEQNYDRDEGALIHNAIPPQSMSCPIQHALNALNPPPMEIQQKDHLSSIHDYDKDTIMGCKTIRFHKTKLLEKVSDAADYLKEAFPCSRIIVNIRRNIESQVESIQGTFRRANSTTTDAILGYNQFLIDLGKELGSDMAKVIDLSEWKEDVNVLNDVVDWLGFQNCKFTSLVHENSNGFDRDSETDVGIDDACHYPH